MTIKLLLADDHQIVLKGISFFLTLQPDFEIVGEAQNGKEAVDKAEELQPDIVVLDLMMPVMDGIEACRIIRGKHPDMKVFVLSSFSDRDNVLHALQAGAIGYMLKDADPEQLAEAIRSAYYGTVQLHPDIAGALLAQNGDPLEGEGGAHDSAASSRRQASGSVDALTPREREVLQLLAQGLSNKEIASALVVAEKTVKTHVSSILGKLHLSDRTQAALFAVQKLGQG